MEQVLLTTFDALKPVLIAVITALSGYFITYLNTKKKKLQSEIDNEKAKEYLDMVECTIAECVLAVKQTFVESLKKADAFTEESQKQAFNLAYTQVMLILTDDCKEYLTKAYGDVNMYLTNKIEAEVNLTK